MNFEPKMGMQDLLAGYYRVVKTIYSQQHYCERILTFFKNYPLPRTRRFLLHLPEYRALLGSIWHIGLWERGRRHYWKLIFWTMRRPQYLHLAVTLSICGYHFRKVVKAVQDHIIGLIEDQEACL
jgi:hypothetical protein